MLKARLLRFYLLAVLAVLLVGGILDQGLVPAFAGFIRLQVTPARLVSDFIAIEGVGSTFFNVAAVGLLGVGFLGLVGLDLSGAALAALFTMMGFAFFGKTVFNCVPIMIGVSISALIVRKKPRDYSLIAMFGTAMGPLITFIAFELGLPKEYALPGSFLIGILVGIAMPPIAIAMLRLHQGYNLYNVGLTAGFLGLFTASISHSAGADILLRTTWGTDYYLSTVIIVPLLSLLALAAAFGTRGRALRSTILGVFNDQKAILALTGRLPSDFADRISTRGALLNSGLMGLLYWCMMLVIGAPFNGPVLGGLFTIMGFSFFGKHPKNTIPVVIGILLAILLFDKNMLAPAPLLAILFGTALAPLAGEFGPVIGIVAGFLHMVLVERTGVWHGGMDLYNNGFAAGLTATLIVSIIDWYKSQSNR